MRAGDTGNSAQGVHDILLTPRVLCPQSQLLTPRQGHRLAHVGQPQVVLFYLDNGWSLLYAQINRIINSMF